MLEAIKAKHKTLKKAYIETNLDICLRLPKKAHRVKNNKLLEDIIAQNSAGAAKWDPKKPIESNISKFLDLAISECFDNRNEETGEDLMYSHFFLGLNDAEFKEWQIEIKGVIRRYRENKDINNAVKEVLDMVVGYGLTLNFAETRKKKVLSVMGKQPK